MFKVCLTPHISNSTEYSIDGEKIPFAIYGEKLTIPIQTLFILNIHSL